MSGDGEGFFSRWSRRKRSAGSTTPPPPAPAPPVPPEEAPPPPGAAPPAFDPATLPPVESLTSGSDFAAFLREEVPAALRRAALRRAWALDPAIRDFVGPADYAWDYNAPDGVPGFSLTLGGDAKKLLAQAIGLEEAPEEAEPLSVTTAEAPAAGPEAAEESGDARPAPADGGAVAEAAVVRPEAVEEPFDAPPAPALTGGGAVADAPAAPPLSPLLAEAPGAGPEALHESPGARPLRVSAGIGAPAAPPLPAAVAGVLAAEAEGAGEAADARPAWASADGERPAQAPPESAPTAPRAEPPAARRRHGGALPS